MEALEALPDAPKPFVTTRRCAASANAGESAKESLKRKQEVWSITPVVGRADLSLSATVES